MALGARRRTGRSRWRLRLSRGAAALALLFGSACRVYVPVASSAPAPGTSVRVFIQPDAVQRVRQEAAGQPMPPHLDGRLLGSNGDSVRISVLMALAPPATQRTRQVFSIASSEVVEMQREVFSRNRTVLLGATVATLLGLAFNAITSSGGAQPDIPGGGDPPPSIIAAFRIVISR